jgi:multidrug efflux pump subunit AcrA (membrane-fusion protein)
VWGTVTRVLVEVGTKVHALDPLVEIETVPPGLNAAVAGVIAAERDLRRGEELARLGEGQALIDGPRCELERAHRELAQARRGSSGPRTTTVVRAAADGEVLELDAFPLETVENAEIPECTPTLLAKLGSLASVHAASIAPPPKEARAWVPAVGAEAKLRVAELPGHTFTGRVLTWGADRAVVEIDNPERLLRAGTRGTLVVEER